MVELGVFVSHYFMCNIPIPANIYISYIPSDGTGGPRSFFFTLILVLFFVLHKFQGGDPPPLDPPMTIEIAYLG
jgi:hypothetical protein